MNSSKRAAPFNCRGAVERRFWTSGDKMRHDYLKEARGVLRVKGRSDRLVSTDPTLPPHAWKGAPPFHSLPAEV
ncbi:hypothetical protein Sp245p_26105 (plasmid) [Azospirillum baldaniorum]|uniref:Uncharacterized protein n=1 Tax=Azospirillum baldaniorum TaxID=1064539 RepID=A0A9P1NRQ8_9PROT|nr:hypothetical protein Sp245p_26105 [Azospirillum baldaniorum]CCD02901.1 protein of unknown function [Azospirillum baldaniorum]